MTSNRRRFLAAAGSIPVGWSALYAAASGAALEKVRLSVLTDEIDEDVETAARLLQEFGVRWAEIRSIWGKYNTVQPAARVRDAGAILNAHQVKTAVLGTAFFRGALPPQTPQGHAELDQEWALLDAAIERAHILGVDCLRTFAFTFKPGETFDAKDLPRTYELLREAARRARKGGVRLAVENLEGSYFVRGATSAQLLKNVQDDALGLTWDPNNAAQDGELSFPDGYRLLDPARIFHVHLRDFRHTAAGKVEWCAVGQGEFDNLGQMRALLTSGYKGAFSLETHYHHPDGKAAATRVSLSALTKLVDRL